MNYIVSLSNEPSMLRNCPGWDFQKQTKYFKGKWDFVGPFTLSNCTASQSSEFSVYSPPTAEIINLFRHGNEYSLKRPEEIKKPEKNA